MKKKTDIKSSKGCAKAIEVTVVIVIIRYKKICIMQSKNIVFRKEITANEICAENTQIDASSGYLIPLASFECYVERIFRRVCFKSFYISQFLLHSVTFLTRHAHGNALHARPFS